MPATFNMTDTLRCDPATMQALHANSRYDYNREFMRTDNSLFDDLWRYLQDKIDDTTSTVFSPDTYTLWLWIGIAVAVIIVIYLYMNGQLLFGPRDGDAIDYEVTDDDIEGIDFPTAIAAAVERGNHREACRLTYLHTLKTLSDGGYIDWQRHKTPTQYAGEHRAAPFAEMTRLFMRVRYGNFNATATTFARMRELREQTIALLQPARRQEGGEPS